MSISILFAVSLLLLMALPVWQRIRRRSEEDGIESHLNNRKRQYLSPALLPDSMFIGINIGDWNLDHVNFCYTRIVVKARNTWIRYRKQREWKYSMESVSRPDGAGKSYFCPASSGIILFPSFICLITFFVWLRFEKLSFTLSASFEKFFPVIYLVHP